MGLSVENNITDRYFRNIFNWIMPRKIRSYWCVPWFWSIQALEEGKRKREDKRQSYSHATRKTALSYCYFKAIFSESVVFQSTLISPPRANLEARLYLCNISLNKHFLPYLYVKSPLLCTSKVLYSQGRNATLIAGNSCTSLYSSDSLIVLIALATWEVKLNKWSTTGYKGNRCRSIKSHAIWYIMTPA